MLFGDACERAKCLPNSEGGEAADLWIYRAQVTERAHVNLVRAKSDESCRRLRLARDANDEPRPSKLLTDLRNLKRGLDASSWTLQEQKDVAVLSRVALTQCL